MKKQALIFLCIAGILTGIGCVRYDKKCKADHKAAKKKGTRGWVY